MFPHEVDELRTENERLRAALDERAALEVMRCDGCQHWDKFLAEWEPRKAGVGVCMAVRSRREIMDEAGKRSLCASLSLLIDQRIAALKAARAYVQDGSAYHAELFTAPDFFCALYQLRE